jgi:hypothetical protein
MLIIAQKARVFVTDKLKTVFFNVIKGVRLEHVRVKGLAYYRRVIAAKKCH